MTEKRLSARDTFAMDWYFFKLDLLLAGLPNKQVKSINRDLKQSIAEAVADGETTVSTALEDLGSTGFVAQNYLDAHGKPVPRVWAGIVAFAVLLYGWLLGVISLLEGMHDVASALVVSETQTITSNWLFVNAHVEVTPSGVDAFGFAMSGWNMVGFLAMLVVIPLISARIWRAWSK